MIKHKLFIVVFFLFTFVGQTFATTAAPCLMMNEMLMHEQIQTNTLLEKSNVIDESNMTMTMQQHMAMSTDADMADCCQELDCTCPVGGCISAMLTININFNVWTVSTQKITSATLLARSQKFTSLYRPPIS